MMRELIKDLVKYIPAYLVPVIIGFVTIAVVSRLFPPEDYGMYVLVTATISILCVIATTWLMGSTVRFFPAYELSNRLQEFHGIFLKLTLVSVAMVASLFMGVLFLIQDRMTAHLHSLMQIGVLVFIVNSCFLLFLSLLRAKRRVSWYSLFIAGYYGGGLGLGVALIVVFQRGVEGLLWGSFLVALLTFPLLWRVALGRLSFGQKSLRSPMVTEIARYGLPVLMVNLAGLLLSVSDRYMLQLFRGAQEVGIYSVSYFISEQSIFFIVSLFSLASVPIAFRIWEKEGVKTSQEFVRSVTRYYLIIALPAVVGLSMLAKPAVTVLAAPAYYEGYRIVPLVAFGAFLAGFEGRFGAGLDFYKRTDLVMFYYLLAALLNLGLNFIFIPKYGYLGAAATTLASYAFLLVSSLIVSRRFFTWEFPFKTLAKVCAASVIMAVAVYLIGNSLTASNLLNLIVGIGLGMLIYFLALVLLRELRRDELMALQDLVQSFKKKGGSCYDEK